MTPLDGILEVALYVADLDAAEHFYGDVLGLERVAQVEGRHVFFRCGNAMLPVLQRGGDARAAGQSGHAGSAARRHGPGHLCFAVADAEIDGWVGG